MRDSDHVRTDTGWEVVDTGPHADRSVTVGSNFLVGNGYLGYRGTRPDQRAADFVGCVVTDTYDMADGVWRELCTVPNGLYVELLADGEPLRVDETAPAEIELAMSTGEVTQRSTWSTASGRSALVAVRRFASLDDLHAVAQQVTVTANDECRLELRAGIDGAVWSLNGDHFASAASHADGDVLSRMCTTGEYGTTIEVASISRVEGGAPDATGEVDADGPVLVRAWFVDATPGATVTLTTGMGVATSNDDLAAGPGPTARSAARAVVERGYRDVLADSAGRWAEFWDTADVRIEGDPDAQAALRFSIYHNRIATPAHTDRLPIGARGLSCQAYQGAAFWDQEMFNLPAYLFTAPEIARNILVYRWRTLDGARRKAERLGYEGAFYAWISGTTGDELCPDFFFEDVLTGRPIRNHFNVWQMHVSPDIAHAVWRYWEATGDLAFMVDHGAEIVFEVARFLHSFVKYDERRDRYEMIRLLGPDEWHENVDNDLYTNRMVELALGHATATRVLLADRGPGALDRLDRHLGLTGDDVAAWERVAGRLFVPTADPDTGLIEQFDGFFDLEDTRPDVLRERLLDPGEYWGWPNGVAVHAQVSKQPAVVQLFAVDPTYPLDVQRANYDYYEPRCAHGSSLSHSVHATVATRLADLDPAYLDRAYDSFMRTATLDLLDESKATVGGTFIGGMHTAANAGAYQTAVFGFGGLDVQGDAVVVDPRLPARWEALEYTVIFRGQRLDVRATPDATTVTAAHGNATPVPVRRGSGAAAPLVAPGEAVTW